MTVHQPRLHDAYGCHHTKVRRAPHLPERAAHCSCRCRTPLRPSLLTLQAFVIEYGTGVRVIIHTAAHHGADNIETRTQGLWWQDFPRKASSGGSPASFPYRACILTNFCVAARVITV